MNAALNLRVPEAMKLVSYSKLRINKVLINTYLSLFCRVLQN